MIATLLCILCFACGSTAAPPSSETPPPTSQLHVTAAIHLEPSDAYARCDPKGYPQIRAAVVRFVRAAVERKAALHLQSDDSFFRGMAACEANADTSGTDGLSLGAWLESQPNVRVDAHKEGGNEDSPDGTGPDNTVYADVHALAAAVLTPSDVVGGFIWQNEEQMSRLLDPKGLTGQNPESPVWQPQILSLAVGQTHHKGDFSEDDASSGVWRPSGGSDAFYIPSETTIAYVGPGLQHADWTERCPDGFRGPADYASAVLGLIDDGSISPGLYTAGLAIPQSAVKATPNDPGSRFDAALAFIDEVNGLIMSDPRVRWSTYEQVIDAWKHDANEEPVRLAFDQIPKERYACSPQ